MHRQHMKHGNRVSCRKMNNTMNTPTTTSCNISTTPSSVLRLDCFIRVLLAVAGLRVSATRPVTALTLWMLGALFEYLFSPPSNGRSVDVSAYDILDVVADNVLRSAGWIATALIVSRQQRSYYSWIIRMIVMLEWTTVATTYAHMRLDFTHWQRARRNDPAIVRYFFSKQMKNSLGRLGAFGLFTLDWMCFAMVHKDCSIWASRIPCFGWILTLSMWGRFMVAIVEMCLCFSFLVFVMREYIFSSKNKNVMEVTNLEKRRWTETLRIPVQMFIG